MKSPTWRFFATPQFHTQAAITRYRSLGGLDDGHLFLTVVEAEEFEIKVLAVSVPRENPFPGFREPPFLLRGHMEEKEQALVSSSSYEDSNPIRGPHLPDLV